MYWRRNYNPSNFKPSPTHYFIRLLHEKGILLRCFTQNIDGLEKIAGIPDDKIIQAHGGFLDLDICVKCGSLQSSEITKAKIFNDEIPLCDQCYGYTKTTNHVLWRRIT